MLSVATDRKRQIVNITALVQDGLAGSGLVNIFVKHTTCALTVADLDPGTDQDYLDALAAMTPAKDWSHPHDPAHFPDHLWSSIIGPSISLPFKDGKLQLGSWQQIILIELDGPRDRQIEVTIIQE